jgi:hypothetical protein
MIQQRHKTAPRTFNGPHIAKYPQRLAPPIIGRLHRGQSVLSDACIFTPSVSSEPTARMKKAQYTKLQSVPDEALLRGARITENVLPDRWQPFTICS